MEVRTINDYEGKRSWIEGLEEAWFIPKSTKEKQKTSVRYVRRYSTRVSGHLRASIFRTGKGREGEWKGSGSCYYGSRFALS
jgi:hypothetical protein